MSTTAAATKPERRERDWRGSDNSAKTTASASAFGGLEGKGKQGERKETTRGSGRGGRGGRGRGRGGAGRGRGKTSNPSPTTTTTATTKPNRRKSIPQIIVPPPAASRSTVVSQELNALVEHVRAGALTPSANAPATPAFGIDWATEDDDDGSLPDLNDWGVNTNTTDPTKENAAAISPILVEVKSLPEPKVPDPLEPETTTELPQPAPKPSQVPDISVSESTSTSTSTSSLHPSLPPKPVPTPARTKNKPGAGRNNSRKQQQQQQPKPVSGGVSLSATPPDSPGRKSLTDSIHAPTPKQSEEPKKLEESKESRPQAQTASSIPPSRNHIFAPTPAPPPSTNGGLTPEIAEFTFPSLSPSPISGHYPVGPRGPGATGGEGESGISSKGLGDRQASIPAASRGMGGFRGGARNNTSGGGIGFNSNGRNGYNNRNNHNHPPRYNQNQGPYRHQPNHFPPSNSNSSSFSSYNTPSTYPSSTSTQPPSTSTQPPSTPTRTPNRTPSHTPHHSREHSVTRPVITGDAISKLARTIVATGSPTKAGA